MIRFLLLLCFLTVLAAALMWVTENDGQMTLEWLGYRVQTSVSVLILCTVLLCTSCTVFLQTFLWFIHAPKRWRSSMIARDQVKGIDALTQGFVAIASGDNKSARHYTKRAESHLGKTTLTRLLSVQTAQLEGNVDAVRSEYTAMLEHKETELIAVKGLLVQARQDLDWDKVVFLSEKIRRMHSDSDWILPILLDGYKRTRQWKKASDTLDLCYKKHVVDELRYHHFSCVLHIAEAHTVPPSEVLMVTDLLHTAYKRDPEFPPSAMRYAERLVALDDQRKARRVLEQSFERTHHPQILEQLDGLLEKQSPTKRLKTLEKILAPHPDHAEGRLILARAALTAAELETARMHLTTALNLRETVYGCKLMAALVRKEGRSQETIESWLERAAHALPDASWRCESCHHHVVIWQYECPSCRSFDSLVWESTEIISTLYAPEQKLIE